MQHEMFQKTRASLDEFPKEHDNGKRRKAIVKKWRRFPIPRRALLLAFGFVLVFVVLVVMAWGVSVLMPDWQPE